MVEVTIIYEIINSVILAITAFGFNLTFGIGGVSNSAYGSTYVLAGYPERILVHETGISFIPAAII